MKTYEAILKRRSIRNFEDKPIDDVTVQLLLEAGMAAPSACNKQPWEFYVIKSQEALDNCRHLARVTNYNAPLMIIVAGNKDHALSTRSNDFWIQDCSAAIENILLAATDLGLGTCWCGLYPVEERYIGARKLLNADNNIVPLGLIQIGYSLETKEARTQYNKDKVHII